VLITNSPSPDLSAGHLSAGRLSAGPKQTGCHAIRPAALGVEARREPPRCSGASRRCLGAFVAAKRRLLRRGNRGHGLGRWLAVGARLSMTQRGLVMAIIPHNPIDPERRRRSDPPFARVLR
jgi:hypothetical protein